MPILRASLLILCAALYNRAQSPAVQPTVQQFQDAVKGHDLAAAARNRSFAKATGNRSVKFLVGFPLTRRPS